MTDWMKHYQQRKHEVILPTKYILTKDEEIAVMVGVAYRLQDNTVKTEVLGATEPNLSVQLIGQVSPELLFSHHHVFVERYVDICLKQKLENVDVFRFYIYRGEYPERPSDLQGETLVQIHGDSRLTTVYPGDLWIGYEHISGPYLADTESLISAYHAGRMDSVSAKCPLPLVMDKSQYLRNKQDLPMVGIVIEDDEVAVDQKMLEDLVLRSKARKREYVN